MADSTIPVQNVTADLSLDTEQLVVGAATVQRERVQLAGALATEIAAIKNAAPATTLFGVVVRLIAESIGTALFAKITDGTDTAAVDASGNLMVALGAALDRTSSPTLSDGAAARLLEINAHGAAMTNLLGAIIGKVRATAVGSEVAEVDGDMMAVAADGIGRLITAPFAHPDNVVSGNASDAAGASTQLIAAGAASVRTYLTAVTVINTSATFVYVELKDGVTVKYTLPAPPTSGHTVVFPTPLRGSTATAWNFDPSAAVTTLICSATGYQSKI